jgi:hypothetical protein
MIIRIFTGAGWTGAAEYGDYDFDQVPRIGEALAFGDETAWDVARVLDVAHRLSDGDTADVALLIERVRQAQRGNEMLPAALLDETWAEEAPVADADTATPAPKGPWG